MKFSARILPSFLIAASLAFSACGTGQDPLDLIDPAQSDFEMDLPFASTTTAQTLTGYSETTPRLGWTLLTTTSSYSVLAPVGGLIVDTESASGASQVTIRVNSTYQVTVASMLTLGSVRAGDEISRGDVVGTTSSAVTVSVERNGTETCPYPFFNATAMDAINLLARNLLVTVCDK